MDSLFSVLAFGVLGLGVVGLVLRVSVGFAVVLSYRVHFSVDGFAVVFS